MTSDRDIIEAAYADLDALHARLATFDYTGLSVADLLDLLSRREKLARSAPVVDHRLLAALQTRTTAKEIGAKNWADVLAIRLRVSGPEAKRRVGDAANLGPRVSLTGEPLPPAHAHIAAAQAAGTISSEHIAIMDTFGNKLPGWVDDATRAQCEHTLMVGARHQSPEELSTAAERVRYLLDQDGPPPDDAEKARKRGFSVGKQGADGMSKVGGWLDPQARAFWEAAQGKLAAPGMCNPDDEHPCISGTPTQAQIDGDGRSAAQRGHDAFSTLARSAVSSGELGDHNGLPVSVVVTTTLQELQAGAGMALTHTGTTLPIPDLIRMAGRGAYHYLAVFDRHTNVPLYLGRARRTATAGQRLMLFARDRGCTRPHCTLPADRCQAHHITDWQHGGTTDLTSLGLACGPDNRLVDEGGWHTTMGPDGRPHWTPPPLLDTGQPRTNTYHHPQLYPTESEGVDDDETSSPTRRFGST
jgi:hypothetical protein